MWLRVPSQVWLNLSMCDEIYTYKVDEDCYEVRAAKALADESLLIKVFPTASQAYDYAENIVEKLNAEKKA